MTVSDNPPRWAQSGLIQIYSVAGGQPKALAASYDGQPNIAGWSADGKRIYFSEAKGTGTQIYAIDVAANRIEEIKSHARRLRRILISIGRERCSALCGKLPTRRPKLSSRR